MSMLTIGAPTMIVNLNERYNTSAYPVKFL